MSQKPYYHPGYMDDHVDWAMVGSCAPPLPPLVITEACQPQQGSAEPENTQPE